MTFDRNSVEAFWRARYAQIRKTEDGREATWLDYSSDEVRGQRLQAQTYGLMIEASGNLEGARLLDAGCGWGRLTLAMAALGARTVGLDLIDATVAALRERHPSLEWAAGNFLDRSMLEPLGVFDRIIAVESFQCAGPPAASLHALWPSVAPGGRLIAIMPNAQCPIVKRALAALDGNLFAISPDELKAEATGLPGLARYAMRGLMFATDQWLAPYDVFPWALDGSAWPEANRMMIVCERE